MTHPDKGAGGTQAIRSYTSIRNGRVEVPGFHGSMRDNDLGVGKAQVAKAKQPLDEATVREGFEPSVPFWSTAL